MSDKMRTIAEIEKERASQPNYGNGITLASGFDLGAKSALDSRLTAKTIADRDAHVTGNRAYEGMIVYVEETKKTYQLIDGSWVEFGFNQDKLEQAIADNLTTDSATQALSARQGKVLNEKIEAHTEDASIHVTQEEKDKIADTYTKGEVDGFVSRLDGADSALSDRLTELENLEIGDTLGGLQESIDSVNGRVDDLDSKVDNAVEEIEGSISDLDSKLDGAIDTIEGTITDLETELKNADTALGGRIDAVDEKVEGVITDLTALEEALANEIERAEGAESDLSGRLDIIEGEEAGSIKKALKDAQQFTKDKIAELIGGAPDTLDTLKEIADALTKNEGVVGGIVNTLATKASKEEVALKADKTYVDNELAKEVLARKEADTAIKQSVSDLSESVDAKELALNEKIDKMATVVSADEPEDRLLGHVWLELI